MVLIALLALSIMMSNDVVIPSWLHLFKHPRRKLSPRLVLNIRRVTIILVMLLAYGYYQLTLDSLPLVNSGLIALALLAQLAPGILATVLWPRASGLGVGAGILMGWSIWIWQLLLPALNTTQPMLDTEPCRWRGLEFNVKLLCVLAYFYASATNASNRRPRDQRFHRVESSNLG